MRCCDPSIVSSNDENVAFELVSYPRVSIHLIDLNVKHPIDDRFEDTFHPFPFVYEMLCSKMSHTGILPLRRRKRSLNSCCCEENPFSCQFEHVFSFGGENSFHSPYDVKISYSLECILISDYLHRSIHVFDLHSKEYVSSLFMQNHNPKFLCIAESYKSAFSRYEKNHPSLEDALILDVGKGRIRMFDLRRLMTFHSKQFPNLLRRSNETNHPIIQIHPYCARNPSFESISPHDALDANENACSHYIWQSNDFKFPRGMAVLTETCQVFVCDMFDDCIKVLDLKNGVQLSRIEILRPHDVDVFISKKFKKNNHGCQNNKGTSVTITTTLVISSDHDGIQVLSQEKLENEKMIINNEACQCGQTVHSSSTTTLMESEWTNAKIKFEDERLPDDDWDPVHPFSLVVDMKCSNLFGLSQQQQHVIVSDSYHHRIKVYSLHNGKLVKTFGKYGDAISNEFKCTFGLCMNEISGELLVCDSWNNRVGVYK